MKISILRVPSSAPVNMISDMSLLCCPNELLLLIAENLDTKDLNSLSKTCRHLAALLTPLLHKIAVQDKEGTSALHWAAAKGHGPLVKLVIEKGAAIDGQDTSGKTPLQCAVTAGHVELVRLLLDYGAEFPVRDPRVKSALHCAARYGNIQELRDLLESENGGRSTRESRIGELVSMVTTGMNHRQHEAAILFRGKISPTISGGVEKLELPSGYREAVELLQDGGGGSSKYILCKGETPLDRALKRKFPSVVKLPPGIICVGC